MLRACYLLAAFGVLMAAPAAGRAGFYDPAKPTSPLAGPNGGQALPWELFRDQLSDTLRIGDPNNPSKLRLKIIERRDKLVALGDRATALELAELGYWQWRLREPDRALNTLSRAKAVDPRSFWPLANLGTLYQARGDLQEALSHLDAASASFPSPWPGDAAAGKWFRAADRAQMALLRARLREAGGITGRSKPPGDVDSLFPVRFIGPSGQYEAGVLADSEHAKLPADAIAVVQQLLLWFPEDTRLLWLLGELYNATGDIRAAEQVFDECIGPRRFNAPPILSDHRRIVKAAVAALPPPVSTPAESLLPDTGTLWIVGGIGGAIVALFVVLQIRELHRRRIPPEQ
jgi:tetratricopeptide (TPR) repeat protein